MTDWQLTGSIVVYDHQYIVLEAAARSFLSTQLHAFLFVIDHSPEDQLRSIAALHSERIRYIHDKNNPGYGAGHNLAIQEATALGAPYHVVLNPDVYFDAATLELLHTYLEVHPVVAHAMPKILYPDGRLQYLCRATPTVAGLFLRRFLPQATHDWFRPWLNKTEYRDANYDSPMYNIPFLSGCFMFLRMEALRQTGVFDERFFLYLEDADLTRRLLEHYENVYYPEAVAYHHYEKGSYKSLKLTLHHIRSVFTYFRKWGW